MADPFDILDALMAGETQQSLGLAPTKKAPAPAGIRRTEREKAELAHFLSGKEWLEAVPEKVLAVVQDTRCECCGSVSRSLNSLQGLFPILSAKNGDRLLKARTMDWNSPEVQDAKAAGKVDYQVLPEYSVAMCPDCFSVGI